MSIDIEDYFEFRIKWIDEKPSIKLLPRKDKMIDTNIPKKCIKKRMKKDGTWGTLVVPHTPADIEWYCVFTKDIDLQKSIHAERKKYYSFKNAFEYVCRMGMLTDEEKMKVDAYFSKMKENTSHGLKKFYQSEDGLKMREHFKNSKARKNHIEDLRVINRKKWRDDEWRDANIKRRRESGQYDIVSHKHKMMHKDPAFREAFLKRMRTDSRRKLISQISRDNWKRDDYRSKMAVACKNYVVNGIKMNSIEAIVASYLLDHDIDWEYEKRIVGESRSYVPDFILSDSTIIECFGDYWHCNPDIYDDDFVMCSKISAKDKRARDQKRIDGLVSLGYHVVVLWESDIRSGEFQAILEENICT